MAVVGWLALGALAGVLMSRLAHHAPADTMRSPWSARWSERCWAGPS
jgi:hypothetical protein